MISITASLVRRLFEYNQTTGEMRCRISTGPRSHVGAIVGRIDRAGYRRISVLGKLQAAHRIAWLHHYGEMPQGEVDHINGNRDDNRIANLRVVDHSTNVENRRRPRRDNKLGIIGVRKKGNRYDARLCVKGKPVYIGLFATAEAASAAYLRAKRKLHKGCTL